MDRLVHTVDKDVCRRRCGLFPIAACLPNPTPTSLDARVGSPGSVDVERWSNVENSARRAQGGKCGVPKQASGTERRVRLGESLRLVPLPRGIRIVVYSEFGLTYHSGHKP